MSRAPTDTSQLIKEIFSESGRVLSSGQIRWLVAYLEILLDWSSRTNLTRIQTPRDIVLEHFLDSAMGLELIPEGPMRLIDLGAGAGFPGLVLKILRPELSVDLVESTKKKASFLDFLIGKLGIRGIRVFPERAQALAKLPQFESAYEVVTARALGPYAEALGLAIPFCRPLGRVLLYLSAQESPVWPEKVIQAGVFRYQFSGLHHARMISAIQPAPPLVPRGTKGPVD